MCIDSNVLKLLKIRLRIDFESMFGAVTSLEAHESRKPEGIFKVYADL